jgi:hypothetical protein
MPQSNPVHQLALGVGETDAWLAVYVRAPDLGIHVLSSATHRVADDDGTTRRRFHHSAP